jgi:hypothetical protein
MCEKCKDKKNRISDQYQLQTDDGVPKVKRDSNCMYCGRKFVDFYMLRHIGTRVEKDGKLEKVVV